VIGIDDEQVVTLCLAGGELPKPFVQADPVILVDNEIAIDQVLKRGEGGDLLRS